MVHNSQAKWSTMTFLAYNNTLNTFTKIKHTATLFFADIMFKIMR